VINGGAPRSAGLFRGGAGQDVFLVTNGVGNGAVVAVTRERAGGAPQPTSTPIVASKPI
jgi:anti-sigma-K factor RskA